MFLTFWLDVFPVPAPFQSCRLCCAGRSDANFLDFKGALDDMGIDLRDLVEFEEKSDPLPFDKGISIVHGARYLGPLYRAQPLKHAHLCLHVVPAQRFLPRLGNR